MFSVCNGSEVVWIGALVAGSPEESLGRVFCRILESNSGFDTSLGSTLGFGGLAAASIIRRGSGRGGAPIIVGASIFAGVAILGGATNL